ncbi:MAG: AsmA family protein [Terracidiphilus sp.]|nr:AsmA family protein [Terracidiphilus sp.]
MMEEEERTGEPERKRRLRKRLWSALAVVMLLLVVLLVPPMISIGHYKSQITQILSQSVGRPVRLSSVEMRLLPRPGFVLTDLTIAEDPAYGAEPVLRANTVTAAVRLLALWRGKVEISSIRVDEASLNLVRTDNGRWNLDPIFRTATGATGTSQKARKLPFLKATNSRLNIKSGIEKLPFSLINADISFGEDDPGVWRLRMRGQPARTDLSMALADTGIVRLEATIHRAPAIRQMPVHMDVEWKEAQLGQLSRLVLGVDPGWRGDLTGQMQVDGTALEAQVKTRLKATGVHRSEFAPADPMDFDANCTFVYHYSVRSVEKLACDSPLGEGHIRLEGELPAHHPGKLAVDVQKVPVSAGLDALRTLRSGIPDDLSAHGLISGQLTYDPSTAAPEEAVPVKSKLSHKPVKPQPKQGALEGSLEVDGFQLNGGGLSQPVQIAKITFAPAAIDANDPEALATEIEVPAGEYTPLAVSVRLEATKYHVGIRGQAALKRLREFAAVAGVGQASSLGALDGEAAQLDLAAQGAWLPEANSVLSPVGQPEVASQASSSSDDLSGTITLHNARWNTSDLANPVEISDATLHVGGGQLIWDPVGFSYGLVKGTATLRLTEHCPEGDRCAPQLEVHFDKLDTSVLQAALLGARKPGTMLSTLLERFTRRSAPIWPRLDGTLKADTLVLGPATLQKATISFRVLPASAKFTSIDADVLGGQLHASGSVENGDKPTYSIEGMFEKVAGPALCQMLKLHCTGGTVNGGGKFTATGFSGDDLSNSAAGTMDFDWRQGAIATGAPKTLARFSRWTGEGAIARGALTLTKNQVIQGSHTAAVDATVSLTDPPKITFPEPKPAETAHR